MSPLKHLTIYLKIAFTIWQNIMEATNKKNYSQYRTILAPGFYGMSYLFVVVT